jgi:phosphatidylglycerol:prolipoprotein diacylglycerol transferase
MSNYISFPGLGIEEFEVRRVAFSLFGRDIMWYGVIITFAIMLGFAYVLWRGKQNGIKSDDIYDLGIFVVISAVIGARAYYVLTTLDVYTYDSFYDVVAIWDGGIAIYGAIIGGGIAAACVSLYKKLNTWLVLDVISPAVILGQSIGRWGNFTNAEAHGGVTDLPWRMGIRAVGSSYTEYYHPTFLYESVWNIIGFVLLNILFKHKKFNGQIFFMYIAWYGLGRMFIEGLRTDSLYVGPFRISQLVGAACFIVGTVAVIVGLIKNKKEIKNGKAD